MIFSRRVRHSTHAFLALAVTGFTLVWFSLAVLPDSEQFAIIWYASAAGAFALTCFPRYAWPIGLLGFIVGIYYADTLMDIPSSLSVSLALVNGSTALLGCFLYRTMRVRFGNALEGMWPFIRGIGPTIVLSPLLGAGLGASVLSFHDAMHVDYALGRWYLSEFIGFVALFPLLLVINAERHSKRQNALIVHTSPSYLLASCVALFALITAVLYAIPYPFIALTGLFCLAATLQSRLIGLSTIALAVLSFDVLSAMDVLTFHLESTETASVPMLATAATTLVIGVCMTQLAYSYRQHQRQHTQQHSLLTQAMHNSLIGMAILDSRGYIQDINQSLATFWGYRQPKLRGVHVSRFTREEDQDELKAYLDDLIIGKIDNKRMEKRFVRSDGYVVWGRLSVTAVRDKHAGHVTHLISQVEDINQLKAAQREQKRWLARWRFALDINKLAVFELNTQTGLLIFSDWSAPLLGIQAKKIRTYQAWLARIHPEDRPALEQAMKLLVDGHTERVIEVFRFQNASGEYRYLRQSSARQDDDAQTVLSTAIDITEQYLANVQNDTLRRRLEAATQAANIGIWEYHVQEDRLEWDSQMYQLYDIATGAGYETLATWQQHIHGDDFPRVQDELTQALANMAQLDTQFRIIDRQGHTRYLRALATTQFDDNGQPIRMIGANWDNTEINELNATLATEREQLNVVMNSINDGVITLDEKGHLVYLNNTALKLANYREQAPIGQSVDDVFYLFHHGEPVRLSYLSEQQLNTHFETHIQDAYRLVLNDTKQVYVSVAISPLLGDNEKQSHRGYVVVLRDVSEQHALMAQLDYNANHDPLTQLPNRRAFEAFMEQHLVQARELDIPSVLAFIDLDLFKIINDSVGHHAGDEVLCQVSQALADNIRSDDAVARLGGDEFAVLLTNCNLHDAKRTIKTLIHRLEQLSFPYGERIFSISASVGLVNVTDNALSLSDLMSRADVAMYSAKSTGRGQIVEYDDISGSAQGRHNDMQMVGKITRALAEDRFTLYGQQVAPVEGPTVEHWYELLVRMVDTDGSIVSPGEFIPAAEAFGHIRDIDEWVANYVLTTRAQELAYSGLRFNINLSAHSISDPNFQARLKQLVAESVFPTDRLCFEITESALISHLNSAISFVDELRAYGAHVALDDFGSGLCSFHYLKLFNVDVVKVDGQFVANLADKENKIDRVIIESIVNICNTMQYKTVAEWVSDEEKLALVKDIGIDYVQGFLIDHPTPLDTLLAKKALKKQKDV
ncbi:hypothetical protein BZJ17_12130 [Salinivibrio sp. IB574]|uniref:EAL domain-containing protein n=1 Tax=Salinivibrio sp. IB574 TaxID=1909444 RepID=UPI0009898A79|nr:EAL domain-containing protein [Salinivibrio sp. IB574]OOF20651.1 hypothetical protein BZJ17_12130 [Salinivibrio sp. IB574]